jgi:hypothetical protein
MDHKHIKILCKYFYILRTEKNMAIINFKVMSNRFMVILTSSLLLSANCVQKWIRSSQNFLSVETASNLPELHTCDVVQILCMLAGPESDSDPLCKMENIII